MQSRSDQLQKAKCRDIKAYNLVKPLKPMRPLVVIIDEYADLVQTDLIGLSGEISALMSGYCDAIGACKLIPVLSVLPLPKLYFQLLLWIICSNFVFCSCQLTCAFTSHGTCLVARASSVGVASTPT